MWQAEAYQFKFHKADFLDPVERMLMDSGYESRETRKANRIPLEGFTSKISKKIYNPKARLDRMKNSVVKGNRTDFQMAEKELNKLEKQQEKEV